MFVFITLYDSWSLCVAEGWEELWSLIVELDNKEVGRGLNIPGRGVDGDYRCKDSKNGWVDSGLCVRAQATAG